jgi:hypothetical protein
MQNFNLNTGPRSKHAREPMLQFVEHGSPESRFVEPGSNLLLACTRVNTQIRKKRPSR